MQPWWREIIITPQPEKDNAERRVAENADWYQIALERRPDIAHEF